MRTDRADNPEAARRVARTIYDGCARLRDFPHLGRASSRIAGRRELVFSPLPYIAVYQVTENAVEISHIFHGAQAWR
jgi:plasmid stabilization system protein ParE